MIKTMLDISDLCLELPWFESEMEANKLYAESMCVFTDIHIFCKNKNLCNHIKSFVVGDEKQDNGM